MSPSPTRSYQLRDAARLVRSKNAGPHMLTIDIMFDDPELYRLACDAPALSAESIAKIYGIPPSSIRRFEYAPALALKFTFPRPTSSGDATEGDVYGGQFHSPLVCLPLRPDAGGFS